MLTAASSITCASAAYSRSVSISPAVSSPNAAVTASMLCADTAPAAIFSAVIAPAATFSAVTDPAAIFSAVIAPAAIFRAVTEPAASSPPSTVPTSAAAFTPPSGVMARITPESSRRGVSQKHSALKPPSKRIVCRVTVHSVV